MNWTQVYTDTISTLYMARYQGYTFFKTVFRGSPWKGQYEIYTATLTGSYTQAAKGTTLREVLDKLSLSTQPTTLFN